MVGGLHASRTVRSLPVPLPQLRRVRWAVRATLVLGVAASVVANILHAQDNPVSQAIAAWPPLALLLTVELISRVPVHRRSLAAARLLATATIAGIAAWVSYWHMAGVAARYGETGASPYLLPLSVDGLILVASICLVELAGRIASLEHSRPADARPTATHIMVDTLPADTADSRAPPPRLVPAPRVPTAPRPAAHHPGADPGDTPPRSTTPPAEHVGVSAGTRSTPHTTAATREGATGATPARRSTAAALAEVAAALPRSP